VTLYVVLPGGVDDPAAPSGGNRYDRAVCDGLARTRDVHEFAVNGAWPNPAAPARTALDAALAGLPDHADVLLDGLVACGVPEIVEAHAGRLRLVLLVHLPLGDETGLAPADAAALTARERRAVHAAAAVVVTSDGAARRVRDLHGLPPEKVHVAPPGVDPAPVAAGSATGGRLLCVAAVTPRKGHDVLIGALTRLGDLDWTCTCAGATPYGVPPAPDRVRFPGPLTGDALAAAYAGADLLVLPSRAETYGMVVTEALARGLPVIATEVGGLPEALGATRSGRRPGLLVPAGDSTALEAALGRWLTDARLRAQLREAAQERRASLPGWRPSIERIAEVLSRAAV